MYSQLARTGLRFICSHCLSKQITASGQQARYKLFFVPKRQYWTSKTRFANNKAVPEKPNSSNGKKQPSLPRFSEVKRLISLAKPERWKLAGAVGLLFVSSTVSLSVPFCIGYVIDLINTAAKEGQMRQKLNTICSVLVVVFLVGGLANFGRVYLMQISGYRIVTRMREKLFASIMRQEVGFFDKTKTGELINRLSTDTSLVGQSVTMNISDGLRAMAQAIGSVGMMFYVSPKLALLGLCIVPPVAIMSRIYGRYLRNITKAVQDSLAAATTVAEERISNIRTVRAFAQEDSEKQKYNSSIAHVLKLSYKEALARGIFWGSTGMSGNLIIISVFYAGGIMMQESLLTVGQLSAFLMYAAYVGVSIGATLRWFKEDILKDLKEICLTSFYTELMRALGASSRIWELSDRTPLIPYKGGLQLAPSSVFGNIEFRDLSFIYPSREDAEIFSGFNLTVPAGSVTAVVGSSGSGKSTLGGLLLRFYDPDTGGVYLDGHDIKTLDPIWLRNQIGTVSQEPVLFSCSVADNIKYGAQDPSSVTMEMIYDAAKQAYAYDFVMSFPDQFDTLVGERGLMLSGGQRQRIALARAILKNPKILLLDEATSALDAESEHLVKEALDKLMVGRTVITIAHRLSTIKTADQIAVLDAGKVAELGSYQDLIQIENGMFKRLVEKQTITT